jgi:hypothetical protein
MTLPDTETNRMTDSKLKGCISLGHVICILELVSQFLGDEAKKSKIGNKKLPWVLRNLVNKVLTEFVRKLG